MIPAWTYTVPSLLGAFNTVPFPFKLRMRTVSPSRRFSGGLESVRLSRKALPSASSVSSQKFRNSLAAVSASRSAEAGFFPFSSSDAVRRSSESNLSEAILALLRTARASSLAFASSSFFCLRNASFSFAISSRRTRGIPAERFCLFAIRVDPFAAVFNSPQHILEAKIFAGQEFLCAFCNLRIQSELLRYFKGVAFPRHADQQAVGRPRVSCQIRMRRL